MQQHNNMVDEVVAKAATSFSATACACGCGTLKVYLHDEDGVVFATAEMSLNQIQSMYDDGLATTAEIRDKTPTDIVH